MDTSPIEMPPSNEWIVKPIQESIVTAANDVPTAACGLTPAMSRSGVINTPPPSAISPFIKPTNKPSAIARFREKYMRNSKILISLVI